MFKRPLRLAVFAPLPPQGTGVADYIGDLLPHLLPWAEVDLYIDDYRPDRSRVPAECAVYPHREFLWRRAEREYDCPVYHLGNSPYHRYLYPYAGHYPGVVVLHDQVLHHLLAGMGEQGNSGFYFREMAYATGATGVHAAWEVLMGQSEAPFYHFALNDRLLDVSLGVAVHSRYLVEQLTAARPGALVAQIPMGVPLPTKPGTKPELRAKHRLPAAAFLVGSFGQGTRQKRLPEVLQAVANLVRRGLDVHYLVVGNIAKDLDIAGLAGACGIAERVTVTGYVDETAYNEYLHAVDVCVNLRYPTAGETSAAALRCMAAGKPTLVSDIGANREFPDDACLKLPVSAAEVSLVEQALTVLAQHPEAGAALGAAASAYVAQEHSMAAAARSFVRFVERALTLRQLAAPAPVATSVASPLVLSAARTLGSMGLTAQDLPLLRDLADTLAMMEAPTDTEGTNRLQEAPP